ncbi:MAG: SGNH/GDSL hydrolase family protein [Kiritimatiellae bacterium]|jgi:lysophospholipase L1-like esterase|nr:SGNH/GDSL hydrolase family protein [Kiritimatiellia bacterium]
MKRTIVTLLIFSAAVLEGVETIIIPATDARLEYSDFVNKEEVETTVVFDRTPLNHGRKYHLDNPGARLRFRCNSKTLSVDLTYERRDDPVRAQNGTGVFLVDGSGREEWAFHRVDRKNRKPETVQVVLPADGTLHTYELVMPYADRVGVKAVICNKETVFMKPAARPALRCAFFGDSVTHGFTSSRVDRCYPYLVGTIKNWEVVNLGLGGIATSPAYADQLAAIPMDRLVIALGVNDWQGGRNPEDVRKNTEAFLSRFRALKPDVPVTVITPLWVPPTWKPKKAKYDLALYRSAIIHAVKEGTVKNVRVIDGNQLIDHDPVLFNRVAVHPNDKGFAQMAAQLAQQL